MPALRHKIPESQKDRAWRIDAIKTNMERSMNDYYSKKDLDLLRLCAGHMDHTTYNYVTNPMSLKEERYQKYPAKLRNFDFISPLYKRLLALYNERVNDPIVYTKNSNFDSEKSAYEAGLISQSLNQRFINGLIESGQFDPVVAQQQQQEPPMSPEVIKQKTSSLKDLVTVEGQHVMNYVFDRQQLSMKYRKAWENFVKINKCVTFRGVRHDEVIVHNVSTQDVRWYGSKDTVFLQRAEIVVANYTMSFIEAMEIFQDVLQEPEYVKEYGDLSEILETLTTQAPSIKSNLIGRDFFDVFGDNMETDRWRTGTMNETQVCNVTHTQFTSFKKVGRIYDLETQEVVEVTEDYLGDDVYEWIWVPEEREGWCINDTYYIGGYPNDIQLVDPDNPFETYKNYNGRTFMQGDVVQLTTAEMLAHYQEAYNIVKYKIQVTINKNKDKLMVLPLGLLGHMKGGMGDGQTHYNGDVDEDGKLVGKHYPSQEIDTESAVAKSLYYADATQFLFVDETSENAALAAQMIKEIDLSLGNYIEYLIRYAASIKQEAEEYVGFNRFMMARTTASDPVANAQQGMYSGSLVIEEYFIEFEEYLNTEYQAIIDFGRYAFKEGRKAGYVRSNTDFQTLEVTGRFPNHVYGAFVRSGVKTKELREHLMQFTNEMLQNGMPASAVAKIKSGSLNYVEIAQELEAAEEKAFGQKQQLQDSENQAMIEAEAIKERVKDKELQVKIYDIDMRTQTAQLDSLRDAQGFISSQGESGGLGEMQGAVNDIIKSMNDTRTKFADIKAKLKMNKDNNDTKKEVAQISLQVARENKP